MRNPIDDERYYIEEPFRYFRVGEENVGTRDLANTELLSVLPGQHYSMTEKTLRLEFSGNDEKAKAMISISIRVDASPGCGGIVWPAGQILSNYLINKGSNFLQGKCVVELGSGTGLVGLIAAKLGASKVWITDQAPLLDIMQQNLSMNSLQCNCVVAELDWGTSIPAAIPSPDVILAADCVYFEPAFPLLVQTLDALATERTQVFFCYKKRADKRFFGLLKKKFTWAEIMDDPNRNIYNRESITLIKLSKIV
ncbi:MAG: putative methyltransferase-domain-containing protein [Lentinula lateritia]|uniref:Protein-lysine N-methyltransferase EFM6 n=1 Tax=Lentinula lateritia TaxID=40482 RepID=A0ABQ8VWK8_9AGAR|nr:MAG: putative methyltransferase-domain-containing protein [Lentinula lateritia]KAJ4499992.1 putative methyltransferase-domain-containing protein [Lentinula lateritia]